MSDEIIPLLTVLLQRPSVTPEDAGCQDLIAARLESAGFTCQRMAYGAVSNLWARNGTEPPLLCFAGHTDVVPPGPADAWTSEPFVPEVRGDRLYARGAADMKSGLAAMIVAAERFLQSTPEFRGSIAFLITSDEEGIANDGTKKVMQVLSERGERIDWCIVGEPSSNCTLGDVVRIGRRGSLNGHLTVNGIQGHVAYPQLADNPIARFAPVLGILCETEWDAGNAYFPPTSFQVVSIVSDGGATNVTPSNLRATFNFRYSDEWHYTKLQAAFIAILDQHSIDYALDWALSGEPFITAPGKLTDTVSDAILAQCGLRPQLSTGGGTSDGRFIAPYGAEVVEFGPINESIHQANEYVDIDDLGRLAMTYRHIMRLLLT